MIKAESAPVELKPPDPAAVSTPAPAAAKPADTSSEESKIVITLTKVGGIVGIQRGNFDPQFFQVKDLPAALTGIPAFMGIATKRWETHPLYPKTVDVVPAATKPAATKTAKTTGSTPAPKPVAPTIKPKVQNAMF
jgi:hypothetical protein